MAEGRGISAFGLDWAGYWAFASHSQPRLPQKLSRGCYRLQKWRTKGLHLDRGKRGCAVVVSAPLASGLNPLSVPQWSTIIIHNTKKYQATKTTE